MCRNTPLLVQICCVVWATGCNPNPKSETSSQTATSEQPADGNPDSGDGADTDSGAQDSGKADSGTDDTSASTNTLRVMVANVGHLGAYTGVECPESPYQGALCSIEAEGIIQAQIAEFDPDVAFLLEVVDANSCPKSQWKGDADLPCTSAPEREPYQQVRRLLSDAYTISCDAIAGHDCVAVRSDAFSLDQCDAGELCIGGNDTLDHPKECAENGGITSTSRVTGVYGKTPLTLVVGHPLNALNEKDDPCRLAQYQQLFETLPGEGATLLGGDFNMDSYRAPTLFPSSEYWHTMVGPEQRFIAHNVPEGWGVKTKDESLLPLPTWMGAATLDFVLSDFASGSCLVLGESDETERLDGKLGVMDHRAVVCDLTPPTVP